MQVASSTSRPIGTLTIMLTPIKSELRGQFRLYGPEPRSSE